MAECHVCLEETDDFIYAMIAENRLAKALYVETEAIVLTAQAMIFSQPTFQIWKAKSGRVKFSGG